MGTLQPQKGCAGAGSGIQPVTWKSVSTARRLAVISAA